MLKRKIYHDSVSSETHIKRKRYCVPNNGTNEKKKKKKKKKVFQKSDPLPKKELQINQFSMVSDKIIQNI